MKYAEEERAETCGKSEGLTRGKSEGLTQQAEGQSRVCCSFSALVCSLSALPRQLYLSLHSSWIKESRMWSCSGSDAF